MKSHDTKDHRIAGYTRSRNRCIFAHDGIWMAIEDTALGRAIDEAIEEWIEQRKDRP